VRAFYTMRFANQKTHLCSALHPGPVLLLHCPPLGTFTVLRMQIYLAPMEGVVDYNLRQIYAAIGGVDTCVTEFIRVTQHLLPDHVFTRYCPELLRRDNAHIPIRVQLLGSDPAMLALNAQRAASLGASGIDLNFGCPAKTVNRHRGGACLLDDTALLAEIVAAVRAAVPADIPVTAKIRLGYENRDTYLKNALAIQAAGAAELAIHARSKSDGYRPPAYWDCIGEVRNALIIPVIANGEIWSVEDFLLCREQSRCEAVMLGRGLLAQPDLALQIKKLGDGRTHNTMPWSQLAAVLRDYFQMTVVDSAPKYIGNRVKQWLHYLKINYREAELLFEAIKRERDAEIIDREIARYCA